MTSNKMTSLIALVLIPGVSLVAADMTAPQAIAAEKISRDCMFNGKKMYGRVQAVTSSPDIKVQVVNSFPDLNVQKVSSFPDSCGKWQIVDLAPDLKVQFVTSLPDLGIKYVESFPGLPGAPARSQSHPTIQDTKHSDFCSKLPKGETEEERHKLGAIFVRYSKSGKKPPKCLIERLRDVMEQADPDFFQSSDDPDICSMLPRGDNRDDLKKLLQTNDVYEMKGEPVPDCITRRMRWVLKRVKMRGY